MSRGPWKSEPSVARARAVIVTTPGGAERRFRHPHLAKAALNDVAQGGGASWLRRSS